MDDDWIERFLQTVDLERFTDQTINDTDTLRASLSKIRRDGYSADDEEKSFGMRCIAAPVFDVNGEAVAGISVLGPTNRVSTDGIKRMSRPVIEAAGQLTRAIGGALPVS